MSADARWVRLNVDWDESEWLANLPWHVRAAWPIILAYVKVCGHGGKARAPIVGRFAAGKDVPEDVVIAILDAAVAAGAMIIANGQWIIAKWQTYQEVDRTNAERQQRYREVQKSYADERLPVDSHNVDVTQSNGNITEGNGSVTDGNGGITPLLCHATGTETKTGDTPPLSPPKGGHISPPDSEPAEKRTRAPRMRIPSAEEVAGYFRSQGGKGAWARGFWDYYTSNGWKVGRGNPMRDWEAAARRWITEEKNKATREAVRGGGAVPQSDDSEPRKPVEKRDFRAVDACSPELDSLLQTKFARWLLDARSRQVVVQIDCTTGEPWDERAWRRRMWPDVPADD